MTGLVITSAESRQNVGMGQILLGRAPARLGAVLGSCVGVSLWSARSEICAVAHVVLPAGNARHAPPGKFADTAVPCMLDLLIQAGARRSDIAAKIAGGAQMFGRQDGPMQIGAQNIAAVEAALKESGVPLERRHLGGSSGRRIVVECESGRMTVEIAGRDPVIL